MQLSAWLPLPEWARVRFSFPLTSWVFPGLFLSVRMSENWGNFFRRRDTFIRPKSLSSSRVRKSRYWEEMLLSPIHCCDVTKPTYLLSGELCTSSLHSNRFYMYTVCCWRGGQCFSVLITRHTDVVGDSSGRSYVTEQGHNVSFLRTRDLAAKMTVHSSHSFYACVCIAKVDKISAVL